MFADNRKAQKLLSSLDDRGAASPITRRLRGKGSVEEGSVQSINKEGTMESLMKSVHKLKAAKQLRKSKGFTLIELMIVVAIIGILAAIAIPNFLTYQLKSRQAEAKTNLQAIKTSEVAFQAERGCYIGMGVFGVVVPAPALKTAPFTWGTGPLPATVPALGWCIAGGTFVGRT